uniref:SGNH hydrolase-type esterase domain-containing protein n=1 Tax=Xiphophorus couchianus TaxID=32473 RepID=A0A3B5LSR0_9TELE
MPKVLIVGDEAVNGISHVCNPKKTRVISFPGDTVSDLTRKVLSLTADQPDIESLVVHVGANDVAKQKSEILKKDFNILLNTMGKLKMKVFLSGPIPSPQWGDEKHSRLDMINKWLIKTCSASSVTFIDNLWIYWHGCCLLLSRSTWDRTSSLTQRRHSILFQFIYLYSYEFLFYLLLR